VDEEWMTIAEAAARCGRYLDLKVRYWSAREAGDLDKAAAVAEELAPIIRRMNPKDNP
jgi:hypothetical protein